jgi:DNA repair protein SbcC/Rad50
VIPLKLTIEGFGPFRHEQVIDFAELGDTPLFLINGPTGAGKTTILDAMCYALYDRATWKSRAITDMRCHKSTPDEKTRVIFDFHVRGKNYRVEREPKYARRRKGGKSDAALVQNPVKATLWEITMDGDEEVLVPRTTNPGQVTGKVKEIVGLDDEQFCQVIVLPQGMTRELLTEKSSDRERVYESLFRTTIYKAIETELKQRKGDIDSRSKSLDEKVRGILAEAGVATKDDLQDSVKELAEQRQQAQGKLDEANKAHADAMGHLQQAQDINEKFKDLQAAKDGLQELQADAARIAALEQAVNQHRLAAQLQPSHSTLARALKESHRATSAHDEALKARGIAEQEDKVAQQAHDEAAKQARGRDALLARSTTLNAQLAKLGDLSLKQRAVEQAEADQKAALSVLERAITSEKAAVADLAAIERAIAELGGRLSKAPNIEADQIRLRHILAAQSQSAQCEAALEQARAELAEAESRLAVKAAQHQSTDTQYLQLQKSWHLYQAAVIAEQLEEGAPCPVCGSIEHPSVAIAAEDHVNQEALDAAREEASRTAAAKAKLEGEISGLANSVEARRSELDAAKAKVLELNPQGVDAQAGLQELERVSEQYEQDTQRLQKLNEQELPLKRAAVQAANETAGKASQVQVEAQTRLSGATQALSEIEREIPPELRDEASLRTTISELASQLDSIDAALEASRKALQAAANQLAARQADASSAQSALEHANTLSTDAREVWEAALRDSRFDTEAEWQQALMEAAVFDASVNEVQAHRKAVDNLNIRLEERGKELAGKQPVENLAPLNVGVQAALDTKTAAASAAETAVEAHAVQSVRSKQLDHATTQREILQAEFGPVDELYRLASGSSSGNVSLHRHVQGKLLDEVVARANHHCQRMTDGRYTLRRRLESSGGGGHDGLALNIYDMQSATQRSVSTLSGGESFQAQTALALGLSETVQAHAGGVQLETLFIDEGFGSLDAESLQLAIATLMDLQASGRCVGIISHVSELNAQIDTQIQVQPGREGSWVSLIV